MLATNNGLLQALKDIRWADLPKAIDTNYKGTWLKAIVKVRRTNGEESFCLAANDGKGNPRFIRDYVATSIIAEIVSIHPYEEAKSDKLIPTFSSDEQVLKYFRKTKFKRSEIESLLSKDDKTSEQIEVDRARLNEYIEQVAIEQAKRVAEANESINKFVDAADPKLKDKNIKAKKYGRTATPRKAKRSKGED